MTIQSRTTTYMTEEEAEVKGNILSEMTDSETSASGMFKIQSVITAGGLAVDLPEDGSFEITEIEDVELLGEPDFGVEAEVVSEYVEQFNGVNFVVRQDGETVLVGNFSVKVV